jgi:hypothetical protein
MSRYGLNKDGLQYPPLPQPKATATFDDVPNAVRDTRMTKPAVANPGDPVRTAIRSTPRGLAGNQQRHRGARLRPQL